MSSSSLEHRYIVGTSGYSFPDWVDVLYPLGTKPAAMFELYTQHFHAVELNYTFYAMPSIAGLQTIADRSPENFTFWVKANREFTHKQELRLTREFIDALHPLYDKLAGVVLQFPNGFARTTANRQFLSRLIDGMSPVRLAVEFRHSSWDTPLTSASLRARNVTLVIPDSPPIANLYRPAPQLTSDVGYLRLHSRNAANWNAGLKKRYDYVYSQDELADVKRQWDPLAQQAKSVYVFFNNCRSGSAARNAITFQKMVEEGG